LWYAQKYAPLELSPSPCERFPSAGGAADPEAQTFTAVFTKSHSIGATVRPTVWPTPILDEGDSLAFDILAVATPDPGADLTVVIQT
jgi:hypothetical protein